MTDEKMNTETLFSPFNIFINCSSRYDEEGVLHQLDLKNVRLTHKFSFSKGYSFTEIFARDDWKNYNIVYTVKNNDWIHIMDTLYYQLWSPRFVAEQLPKLGRLGKVFYSFVGDSDQSYHFSLINNGEIIRELKVDDPRHSVEDLVVVTDIGKPFPQEMTLRNMQADGNFDVLKLAESVGAPITHTGCTVSVFRYNI